MRQPKAFFTKIVPFIIGILLVTQNMKAANILKIGQYTVKPNTELSVAIEGETTNPFVAFQVDIPIPDGFKYKDGSAQLNATRSAGNMLSVSLLSGNSLRILGYSVNNTPFQGTTGALVNITLKSGSSPGEFPLILQNPLLGDSHSNNILTSTITGKITVQAPRIQLSTTGIDFGRVAIGSTSEQSIQISNTGNQNLLLSSLTFNDTHFSTSEPQNSTIFPGENRIIKLQFTPTIKGALSKILTIKNNDVTNPSSTVNLEAIAYAVNEIHAGSITGASSSTKTLNISINNQEEMTGLQFDLNLPTSLSLVSGTPKLYRIQDHSISINQINPQTLRILVYSPLNKPFTGIDGKVMSLDFLLHGTGGNYPIEINNVQIANKTGENILSAAYGGNLQITSADIDASTELNFGDVSILTTGEKSHQVFNYGQEPLIITQLQFSNDYFKSDQTLPITIQPNNSFSIPVKFSKTSKGIATGKVKIISNDPDENPFTIQLTGNAYASNQLIIKPQTILQQDSVIIPIEITNEESFVAFQFDLKYPAWLTPDLNAIKLTDRKQDHIISTSLMPNNILRVLVFSPSQKPFTGTSGAVLVIPMKCDQNTTLGQYPLEFSNAFLSNEKSENILYTSINGSITIKQPEDEDQAPYILNPIQDIALEVGAPNTIIDLKTVFADDDSNDILTYVVTSNSNNDLVKTSIQGTNLILSYQAPKTGKATIEITATSNNKEVKLLFNVEIKLTTNLSDKKEVKIVVYPNPTKDLLHVLLETFESKDYYLIVTDMSGREVLRQSIESKETILNFKDKSPGSYLIRVVGGEKNDLAKILLY